MIGKNNPFNIRHNAGNHWLGQSVNLESHGFCNFDSLDFGIRAACMLIMRSYRKKGVLSVDEIIHRFAPPSENRTDKYVQYVCNFMGVMPFSIPKPSEFVSLLLAMSRYEGNPLFPYQILSVIHKFGIKPYQIRRYGK